MHLFELVLTYSSVAYLLVFVPTGFDVESRNPLSKILLGRGIDVNLSAKREGE